jgi:hypothetical protein
MLLHVRQVLTAEELAALRRTLASVPWGDGRATSGPQSAQATSRSRRDGPSCPACSRRCWGAEPPSPVLLGGAAAADPAADVQPLRRRDHGFGNHIDGAIRYVPGPPGERVRADISCTLPPAPLGRRLSSAAFSARRGRASGAHRHRENCFAAMLGGEPRAPHEGDAARESDARQRQIATFPLKFACRTSEISFSLLYTRSTIRLARKQEK